MIRQRDLLNQYKELSQEYKSTSIELKTATQHLKVVQQEFKQTKQYYDEKRRPLNRGIKGSKGKIKAHKETILRVKALVKQHPEDRVTYPNMLFDIEDKLYAEERTLKQLTAEYTTLTEEWNYKKNQYTSPNGIINSLMQGVSDLTEKTSALHRKLSSLEVRIKTLHN